MIYARPPEPLSPKRGTLCKAPVFAALSPVIAFEIELRIYYNESAANCKAICGAKWEQYFYMRPNIKGPLRALFMRADIYRPVIAAEIFGDEGDDGLV